VIGTSFSRRAEERNAIESLDGDAIARSLTVGVGKRLTS
jgi:hypothetical protein